MSAILVPIRILYRVILILLVLLPSCLFTIFGQRGTMPTSGLSSIVTSMFHRYLSRAMGIKLVVRGSPNTESTLFVSNHISWTDILIIGQSIHTHFLSMIEVKSWPVGGWLASRAGTLYIERGGKKSSRKAIRDITDVLRQAHNVVLFPEGRTTDGKLKKFHSRLIQSAVDAAVQVQPIALKYLNGDSKLAHPAVLYNHEVSFARSLFNILSQKGIVVELRFLRPISPHGRSRGEIAKQAEKQIREHLGQL